MTQAIKSLEKAAGTQLVYRGREGIDMTPSGKIFYEASLRILKEVHLLDHQLNANQFTSRRRLRVGIFESIAIYAWPNAQDHMRKILRVSSHSKEEQFFDLHTGRTDQLIKQLNIGEIDVAIAVDPDVAISQCREHLFDDSFYLYCAPNDAGRKDCESSDKTKRTIQRPLFLFENARISNTNDLQASFLKSYGGGKITFEIINRVDSFEVASEFVRAGLGFALIPERVASRHPKELYKVLSGGREQSPIARHRIFAAAPKSVSLSASFRLLCDAFRAV